MRKLSLALFFAGMVSTASWGKTLTIYAEPNTESKALATLSEHVNLIPIYYEEEGGWVKVADPKDGSVGWAQVDELTNLDTVTLQQRYIRSQTGHNRSYQQGERYRHIRFLEPEEVDALMKAMHERHMRMEKAMQQMVDDMLSSFNDFFRMMPYPFQEEWMEVEVKESRETSKESPAAEVEQQKSWWQRLKERLTQPSQKEKDDKQ